MSSPRRVLVTGASSGIGRAVALRLLEAGWEVWGTSRDPERLPRAERFHPVSLDLANPSMILSVIEPLWARAGRFEALINNAGSGIFGPLAEVSEQEERALFDILYHGPMTLTRWAFARMSAAGGGRIVQVTTVGVELPIPFMGSYSAAKAAFSTATRILRMESAGSPVRIIELRPGDIRTQFNHSVRKSHGSDTPAADKVWAKMEALMASAPAADLVGRKVVEVLHQPEPPELVRVGSWFQTTLAPLAPRLLPVQMVERAIASYYHLPQGGLPGG